MMVLGIDPHKKSHAVVALRAATGEVCGELTVCANERGPECLLAWARGLASERGFAIQDCRHVSGRLERFLIDHGECCVRVPPKLMAKTRTSARRRRKSNAIDAASVARAARREPDLPEACFACPERELRLLTDHRSDLVAERTRIQARLRWHLHDLALSLEVSPKALARRRWLARLEQALVVLPARVQVRIALELTARCRILSAGIDALEREIATVTSALAPELPALPGCGALTAACLVGETAGALRFEGEAQFTMHAGIDPLWWTPEDRDPGVPERESRWASPSHPTRPSPAPRPCASSVAAASRRARSHVTPASRGSPPGAGGPRPRAPGLHGEREGLTSEERAELRRLCRENKVLREEREILGEGSGFLRPYVRIPPTLGGLARFFAARLILSVASPPCAARRARLRPCGVT